MRNDLEELKKTLDSTSSIILSSKDSNGLNVLHKVKYKKRLNCLLDGILVMSCYFKQNCFSGVYFYV